MIPGVTTRNPRVNRGLPGRRTALTVCHAMSMAITVVLPAPVASFRASRESPGLASSFARSSCSRKLRPSRPSFGATSVSQMMASAASIWQKNGWDVCEPVASPVVEEPRCLRGHPPFGGLRDLSPLLDPAAKAVDESHQLVLLALRFERACGLVEAKRLLDLALGRRDRGEERGIAALVHDLAGRLSRGVELPVS